MKCGQVVEEIQNIYEVHLYEAVDMFLGVRLKWTLDSSGNAISLKMAQPLYAEGILRRFGVDHSKAACISMTNSFYQGLSSEMDKSVIDVKIYQSMIGSLLHLALRTRLDILASVLILATF